MTQNTGGEPPDYDALAATYLNLWQEQIAKLAKDPQQLTEAAADWSRTATAMMQSAASVMGRGTHWSSSKTTPHDDASDSPFKPDAAQGPKASGVAHGDGELDSADVLRRLDALERRLAALESSPPKSRSSGRGASGRKKT